MSAFLECNLGGKLAPAHRPNKGNTPVTLSDVGISKKQPRDWTGMIFCWYDHCRTEDPARRCELANLQGECRRYGHFRGAREEYRLFNVSGTGRSHQSRRRGRSIAAWTHRVTVTFASLAKPLEADATLTMCAHGIRNA